MTIQFRLQLTYESRVWSEARAKRSVSLLAEIGLLQQTIAWYKIRHAGGQAHHVIIPALGH